MEERSGCPSTALPLGLAAAIEARLDGRPRAPLRESAARLSARYRARGTTSDAVRDETDALAYALTRMPATYAAAAAALARLAEHWPDFLPRSVLDLGCGLGAASYAASARWPELGAVTLLDNSPPLLSLARNLARNAGVAALANARIVAADLSRLTPGLLHGARYDASPHDLVIVAYALTELSDGALSPLADSLLSLTAGALVIVEPGAPRDHARLMTIRARLIECGARILAPCPHQRPCPVVAPDWCHFSVRLPRSRDHKLLKGADAPFEDEKFSYLIAARGGTPAAARIIAPTRSNKAGATLRLCAQGGIGETFTPRRDKAGFERIRRKDWGDALDAPPEVG